MLRAMLWTLAVACTSITPVSAVSLTANNENLGPTPLADEIRLAPHDRELIARAVIGEAASEGRIGMTAVAHVIRNRMTLIGARVQNAKAFGETVPEILQQFDAMNPRRGGGAYRMAWDVSPQDAILQSALSIVDEVFSADAQDPTGGALFYYNPSTVRTPAWVAQFAPYNDRQIGNHRFVGQLAKAEVTMKRAFGTFLGDRPVTYRMPAPGIQG